MKLMNLQGITVMEVAKTATGWAVDSLFNGRITPMMPLGPAAGHALLQTTADVACTTVLDTLNNYGAGKTLWGSYLTYEEDFNSYFGATDAATTLPDGFDRYSIGTESRYAYEEYDPRFGITSKPNEPNRLGYIVEVDPANPDSTPTKHTAQGRFKHENAAMTLTADNRFVVYPGDDERGEFLYRYVSKGIYAESGDTSTLLDDGTLYAAQSAADRTGASLPLTP